MERITRNDVASAVKQYRLAGITVGVLSETDSLELQNGVAVKGIAWRLFLSGGKAAPATSDRGFVGNTAREAYESISTVTRAWWAVADAKRD